jgi:hypothetical protein
LQLCKIDPDLISEAAKTADTFFKSLKTCTPGHYRTFRPDPIAKVNHTPGPPYFITQVSDIVGLQNNKCLVNNTTIISGIDIRTKCLYSKDSLDYLSDKLSKRLITNYSLPAGTQPELPTPEEVAGIGRVNAECSQEP